MQRSPDNSVVLVSGSGRSGTSSLAGSLKRLGLHVPQPEVQPSPNNPRGYYEPAWVIDFHKGYLQQLALHNIDSRPSAVDMVAEVVATGEPTQRLKAWLSGQLSEPQIVVKDPHALWFDQVWADACAELGVELRWLTALRHPAEVVGSRDIAYLQNQTDELRSVKETSNVAGWIHAALLTEKAGRDGRRSFIRYVDLIDDWRTALAPVQEQLALDFNVDLSSRDQHAVDDFLEAGLRKSQLGWEDLRVPDRLRDMAEEVWQTLCNLVAEPHDSTSMGRLDQIHREYTAMYAEASALTFDQQQGEVKLAVREARKKAREKDKETIKRLRAKVKDLESRRGATVAGSSPPSSPLRGAGRRLRRAVQGKSGR